MFMTKNAHLNMDSKKGRTIFEQGYPTAWLDVPVEKWDFFAQGYFKTTEFVYNGISEGFLSPNDCVYPYVFLARQSLELQLKEIIRAHGKIYGTSAEYKHHKLFDLWKLIINLNNSSNFMEIGEIEYRIGVFLQEFQDMSPTGELFRFPESKNGEITIAMKSMSLKSIRDQFVFAMENLYGYSAILDLKVPFKKGSGIDK